MVSKRFAKANNSQYLDYDKTKPNSWIQYLDAKNLYSWAMMQLLPVGEFHWVNAVDLSLDEVLAIAHDAGEGDILEVGLEYPEHLHDTHSDQPLTPETMSFPEAWLNNY